MFKKIVTLITLAAFLVFVTSCSLYTTKREKVWTAADWEGKKIQILAVLKTSGEKIEFDEERTGEISGNSITGIRRKEVEIERTNIEAIARVKGKISRIRTKDGEIHYVVDTVLKTEEKVVIKVYESVSTPMSEIDYVWIKTINPDLSLLVYIGVTIVALQLIVRSAIDDIFPDGGEVVAF